MYTATCWDSWFFWQLYLARMAGFKRRLDVTVGVVDIVSTLSDRLQWIKLQLDPQERLTFTNTSYYEQPAEYTEATRDNRDQDHGSESANTAERAWFFHHSIALNR